MRRYIIYAAVYGTIGICVGLAMAYVSKDTTVVGAISNKPRGIRLYPTPKVSKPEDEGEATPPKLEDIVE